jgi:hypothetical protein
MARGREHIAFLAGSVPDHDLAVFIISLSLWLHPYFGTFYKNLDGVGASWTQVKHLGGEILGKT